MSALPFLPPVSKDADSGARNVRLLSVLRLLAIVGQLATILFASGVLGVPLPLVPMIAALAVLVVLNVAIAQVAVRRPISERVLFATLLADVACLTAQLYLSGGVANPFVSLYLLQVVIAAVLLPAWSSWGMIVLTSALFAWLASSPFRLPAAFGATLSTPYVIAAWFSYTLAAILLVLFVTRIVRNLAEREAHLAALRERAVEEEHVVRMGLLASGAAHELGTPLASLAVMLSDWRREPAVRRSAGLLADVEEMSGQVTRCKDILGQVLLAAGEVRGDAPTRTSLRAFFEETVAAWSAGHAVVVAMEYRIEQNAPIIADKPLSQTIVNLLDNAAEAGASRIDVIVSVSAGMVSVVLQDDGRGFAPELLRTFGKPYQSSKARAGAGLGLFLASNVLRTLGGTITARNRPEGGSALTLAWPLTAVAAEPAA